MSNALTRARRLTQPKYRRTSGHFLAEGPHLLDEALASDWPPAHVFACPAKCGPEAIAAVERARRVGVPVEEVRARELGSIAATRTPQGVVAVVRVPPAPDEPFAEPGLWLLLDGIQDPGNAGTLLRAADAFAARGALALPGTADLWAGKTVRAAQGAHFRLTLFQDAAERLAEFVAAGGVVWASDAGGESIYDVPAPPPRLMLALGNEARGVSDAVAAGAVRHVAVPQAGRADSLNVAMAGSVLLSWLSRPRGNDG